MIKTTMNADIHGKVSLHARGNPRTYLILAYISAALGMIIGLMPLVFGNSIIIIEFSKSSFSGLFIAIILLLKRDLVIMAKHIESIKEK